MTRPSRSTGRRWRSSEKALGKAHPDYAPSLNNLAALLQATGRYGEAEPLYREALAIDEKTLGQAHPDYAADLNNLAELLQATGRHGEAEPLYREALTIREKALGTAHPDYAQSLNNLAPLLDATGRYGEAEPLYREALFDSIASLRSEHLRTRRALAATLAALRAEIAGAEAPRSVHAADSIKPPGRRDRVPAAEGAEEGADGPLRGGGRAPRRRRDRRTGRGSGARR